MTEFSFYLFYISMTWVDEFDYVCHEKSHYFLEDLFKLNEMNS